MSTGELRVYLGAAPGVGKTYRMLEEGHRRLARGTDVVVAYVETHGRRHTAALVDGLEVVERRAIPYRGSTFEELDVDAVLRRAPAVALVDELAHTNIPGSRHAKRWQDVQALLEAGITVITTVNVQHLESLNDVVQQITGVVQRETVPDAVVRAAHQIELVDSTPEALRRRMAHGNIYPAERVDAALGNYFRVGNLTALRELALLWLADKVDDQLDDYRTAHRIEATWEARERVVVALTGGPEGDALVRRAARVAARTKGADLLAVHVARSDGLADADPAHLARQRSLVENLGGTYHQVIGNDIPTALLDFARGVNATQLVLGASRRGRLAQLFSPGVGVETTALSGAIDVHLVTHEEAAGRPHRGRRWRAGLSRRRRLVGLGLAVVGLPLLTLALDRLRGSLSLPSDILAVLLVVVGVALVGGLWPAVVAAVVGFLLLNWFFTPPLYQFTVAERENLFALLAFLLVAVAVSTVVDLAARRTEEAARAGAEAQTLSTVAGSVLRGSWSISPLHTLLDQVRETFGQHGVTLLERTETVPDGPDVAHDPDAWAVVAAVGDLPCRAPREADTTVTIDDLPDQRPVTLALRGQALGARDRRLVEAFTAQAAIALRQERLAARAAEVAPLTEVDRLRTALLNAVSHDLRTPLATATTAVAGLLSEQVHLDDADRKELLVVASQALARLARLVEDLLDLSRLQAGALAMTPSTVAVVELLPTVLDDLGPDGGDVRWQASQDLPDVCVDAALLERVLVNLLANAVRHTPPDAEPPLVSVSAHGGGLEVRVIDHGPGVPAEDRERIFLPFQRLGDRDVSTGVGLGLALSRGLVEAMGGTLVPDATPGGGLTMVLTLPARPAVP